MGKLIDDLVERGILPKNASGDYSKTTPLYAPQELARDATEEEKRESYFDRREKIVHSAQRSFHYEPPKRDDDDWYTSRVSNKDDDWKKYSKYYTGGSGTGATYVPAPKWVSAGGVVCDGLTPESIQMVYLVRPAGTAFGKLTLPKGRVEVGETKETTALREVAEESGLNARFLPDGYLGLFEGSMSQTHYFLLFRVSATGKGHDDEVEKVEVMHIDEAIKALDKAGNTRDVKVLELAKIKINEILANMAR